MDETQIQNQLKERVPKPEFRDNEQYIPPTAENGESHNSLPLENALLKQQVFDFMDIPVAARNNPDTLGAIEAIMDWAYTESGSRDLGDLLRVINRREAVMGRKGDRLLNLYKYVKISKQLAALAEQERALYGRG